MLKEKSLKQARTNEAGKALEIQSLHKNYGSLEVLRDLSLKAEPGEFVTLIGPSGCGKSTLFNILAGLEEAEAGRIRLDGAAFEPAAKQFAYMPQRDALLVWRTILDNAILGMELQGISKLAARAEALELFASFGLKGFEKSYPFELSGGMRQRAALLRTVLTHRPILLLDEPFGALDALTRASLQEWLLQLQARLGRTILFITHDVEEAILLSDRVYVLSPRPASVTLVQEINLPRPRSLELVTSPEFVALKARLLAALRNKEER
jgi:ABC-type nitrate/sulfonate/bicarbonate transport system ATPase subunit